MYDSDFWIFSRRYAIIWAEENEMSDKNDVEKQVDPRKEILFRQIGAKIAYYRTLRDMSQKELAKRANMSVSSLSKIERGRYNDNVSVSLLFDIADGLQIDITMLVTFSDMEKSMWWKPLSKDWKILLCEKLNPRKIFLLIG